MASRKSRSAKTKKTAANKRGSRSLWKGSLSFGLVNIPVALHAAEVSNEFSFQLLDRRNFLPVRYRRVNEKSGQEVPWHDVIKGYEYEKGEYVALTDADFEKANVRASHTIDITDFIDGTEISPIYYDRPYYLEPLKNAQRSYILLRDAMQQTGKIGIGKIVIRSRQHLAAVIPIGHILVVNLLRFAHELREAAFELPAENRKVDEREVKMAERLIESMAERWRPEKYHDEYRDDLMKLIVNKIKTGETKTIDGHTARADSGKAPKVIDIMDLLKRSVDRAQRKDDPSRRRKAS